jgi:hypothetical protein
VKVIDRVDRIKALMMLLSVVYAPNLVRSSDRADGHASVHYLLRVPSGLECTGVALLAPCRVAHPVDYLTSCSKHCEHACQQCIIVHYLLRVPSGLECRVSLLAPCRVSHINEGNEGGPGVTQTARQAHELVRGHHLGTPCVTQTARQAHALGINEGIGGGISTANASGTDADAIAEIFSSGGSMRDKRVV